MSYVSQLTIIIINYISIFGLLICSLLSLFLTDKRKKLLFLFLSFIFVGVLSFVYYSGVLFFITGIIILFFLVSLYLLVIQVELFGKEIEGESDKKLKSSTNSIRSRVLNIIIPLLFCIAIGYFIYKYMADFIRGIGITSDILIIGLSDIARQFFADYSLVLIIIMASLFISFLWFITIRTDKK